MEPNKPTTIAPFLVVNNGKKAVDFYLSAFGAAELVRYNMGNNKLTAKIAIEGAEFWLGDEEPEYGNLRADAVHGTGVRIILTTSNADHIFSKALEAGATQICPMTTEAYWRIGKLKDPFGHVWEIGYAL